MLANAERTPNLLKTSRHTLTCTQHTGIHKTYVVGSCGTFSTAQRTPYTHASIQCSLCRWLDKSFSILYLVYTQRTLPHQKKKRRNIHTKLYFFLSQTSAFKQSETNQNCTKTKIDRSIFLIFFKLKNRMKIVCKWHLSKIEKIRLNILRELAGVAESVSYKS